MLICVLKFLTFCLLFCRLKLACLHYNENANRAQNMTKSGEPMWQVAVPKFKKGQPVAKAVKVAATYGKLVEINIIHANNCLSN